MQVAEHFAAKRSFIALAVVAALALVVGACGRKGPLEPHPADAAAAAPAQESRRTDSGQFTPGGRRSRPSPIRAPDRPFILDAIL